MGIMEKFEKILKLLEKDNLTKEEKSSLNQIANSDDELRSIITVYKNLNSSLSSPDHIPTDLLAKYVLYENGDDSDSKLVEVLKGKIKFHLAECSICKNEYDSLLNEYSEIGEHVSNSISRELQQSIKKNNFLIPTFFKQINTFKYAFATLSFFVIAYFGLYFISSSVTPEYKKSLFPNDQEDFYKTRGRTSLLFQQGLNAIDDNNYAKAIEYLSMDIKEHQNDKSIFYSHYIIGITYLKASESDFIGLFKSYDYKDVNLAIGSFKESINLNNSGDYESLKLDSYYYIGIAYSLIDDQESAINSLYKVIDGKGRFSKEALALIQQMEKN